MEAGGRPPLSREDVTPGTAFDAHEVYPVSLVVERRTALVVGGGRIAARKVAALVGCGARVTVVAPETVGAIDGLEARGEIVVEHRPYRAGEVAGYALALTATGVPEVDRQVAGDAESAGVWVNVAGVPERSSFHLPAVHRDGPVAVAVSTGGRSPALAAWLRRRLAGVAGGHAGALAELLGAARQQLRADGRSAESVDWTALLEGPLPGLVASGRVAEARRLVRAAVAPGGHLRPSPADRHHRGIDAPRMYRTTVGSQALDLPLVQVAPDVVIALLICVDYGVQFSERAGKELADLLRDSKPEVVVSVATMGIPLAIEVTRGLGLDDYVILHKTPKIHLGNTWAEPVRSITTGADQTLRLDPAREHAVRGRRVAIVDDVVSTGASLRASLNLLRRAGAEPVVVGSFLTEGEQWKAALGPDAGMVRALGAIPLFHPRPDGTLVEDWVGDQA